MSNIKRLFLCLVAVFLLFCFASPVTFATGEENQNLTIIYKDQHIPIEGCEFQLYYVASLTETGIYVPTKAFQGYSLVFEAETIQRLAYTVESYVARDFIAPTKIATTNQWGSLVFENLPSGIYLVLASRHIQNNHAYETRPFIASLAGAPEEVQVFPKSESKPPHPTEETSCKVLKIWDDKGFEQHRPKEIQVDLLENGTVIDTVVLNENNHWRYTWSGLNPTFRYVVAEKNVMGYIPFIDYQGITYTITNTYQANEDPPPSNPSTPPSNPSSNPQSTPEPPGNITPPPEKLPQTGQLWWPVPLLCSLGLVFVIIGLLVRRKHE